MAAGDRVVRPPRHQDVAGLIGEPLISEAMHERVIVECGFLDATDGDESESIVEWTVGNSASSNTSSKVQYDIICTNPSHWDNVVSERRTDVGAVTRAKIVVGGDLALRPERGSCGRPEALI